jgi:hypothetical protein
LILIWAPLEAIDLELLKAAARIDVAEQATGIDFLRMESIP